MKLLDSNTYRRRSPGRLGRVVPAWVLVPAAFLGLGVAPAGSQFRSDVNLVELYVSVAGREDRPLEALARDDFSVFEDGVRQTVSVFSTGKLPLALALALDRSFSVAGTRLAQMKTAAARLIDSLDPADRLLLLGVGSRVDVLTPLGTDRASQRRALATVDAFGSTSLHDAIVVAVDRIQDAPGRRALVLLSDGVDRYSKASASEVLAHAQRRDVLIFPVAVGQAAPPLFVELAAVTGGHAFTARDPGRLGETLRTVTNELRAQYLLGYVSSRPRPAVPQWRNITVTVRRSNARVLARRGYWTQ